jgi:hypothetical protein
MIGPKLVGAAGDALTPIAGSADRPLDEHYEAPVGRDLVVAGRDVVLPPVSARRAPQPTGSTSNRPS